MILKSKDFVIIKGSCYMCSTNIMQITRIEITLSYPYLLKCINGHKDAIEKHNIIKVSKIAKVLYK